MAAPDEDGVVIPPSSDDVCLAFALYISDEATLRSSYGIVGFNPISSPYVNLTKDQRARFTKEDKNFLAIKAFFVDKVRNFWNSYEHSEGHLKQLEEVVSRTHMIASPNSRAVTLISLTN